jgi:hypothetical protein
MNTKARYLLILSVVLFTGFALWGTLTQAALGVAPLAGGTPQVVAYQGEVRVLGTPFTGDGYFKFAVVNAAGDTAYWSNDGTSVGGSEPTAAVQLAVSEGLFGVLLGDTSLGGMTQALTAAVFDQPDSYLRVWFSSDNITFDQLTPDTRIAAVPYALQAQEALDADTVDGLHASELGAHYQGVVIVAKNGGDYTDVQAAIDSITDAAADTPYLVWVAPGVYSETVTMKPYVHLQGAGQEATIITSMANSSDWPPAQATLVLASNTSLRDLTVDNSGVDESKTALLATAGMTPTLVADVTARALGSGTNNYAIFLSGSDTGITLQQVTALAESGSNINAGLINYSGATAVLQDGNYTARGGANVWGILNGGVTTTLKTVDTTATAREGTEARGIYNVSGAKLEAEGVTALAENATTDNMGLANVGGAAATLRGGSFTGRGGTTNAFGIGVGDSGTILEAEDVTALGQDCTSSGSFGLNAWDGAEVTLRGGIFTGYGGLSTAGIGIHFSSTLEATSVTALGENGTTSNTGLVNHDSVTTALYGGSFTGRGGENAQGISTGSTPTLEAMNISARGENGSIDNYGLAHGSGTATFSSSQLTGSSNGLNLEGGTVYLGVTQLDGGATTSGGTLNCFQVYDSSYSAYTCP